MGAAAEAKEGRRKLLRALRRRLLDLATHPRIPEGAYLTGVAIVVGLATGLSCVLFLRALGWITWLSFEASGPLLGPLGPASTVLPPVVGGLALGLVLYRLAAEARAHDIPEVMASIALKGGRISGVVSGMRALSASITLGSGGSGGQIGPVVQLGAGLGSTLGQFLKMSDQRIITLAACGAAGGVAATLNAPIAGAMFALEILVGHFTADFSLVILSSVTAAIVSRWILGNFPAFLVPSYDLVGAREMLLYVVLGILTGLAGAAFVRALDYCRDRFERWQVREAFKPAIGGLCVGVLALLAPGILGTGMGVVEEGLNGRLALGVFLLFFFAKLVATPLTLGSGGAGGVFAPSLFLGAMLGGAYGHVVNGLFPGFTGNPGAYALVGMGALFGGAAQAPITAIIILFEMTGDYRIILPIMAATGMSVLIYKVLEKETIYTRRLKRLGLTFRAGRDVDLMASIPVRDALTHRLLWVPEEMTAAEFLRRSAEEEHEWFPVLNPAGELTGVVTAQDVRKALDRGDLQARVGSLATREVVAVTPDDSLQDVLVRFQVRDLGHLPVVEPRNPKKLVGIVSRLHVIRAYNQALVKKHVL
jgi:CIC family chloride channel protein